MGSSEGGCINWITTLQGGQPLTLNCPTSTTAGTGCYDVTVPGQSPKLGIKVRPNASGHLTPYWLGNPQPSNSLASWATTINRYTIHQPDAYL